MRSFVVYMSLLFLIPSSSLCLAADKPEPRKVKKGYEITVNSYDAQTDMFLFTIQSESAVGPNYARSEDLRRAIAYEGSSADFRKQRAQMNGSVYSLKKDLRVYELDDVAQLKKKK